MKASMNYHNMFKNPYALIITISVEEKIEGNNGSQKRGKFFKEKMKQSGTAKY